MSNYIDLQRVDIAKQEYKDYQEGKAVKIDGGSNKIGYVSKIVNNKDTGEQSYIITDIKLPENPTLEQLASVKNVTVLYRGSTAPFSGNDWMIDWFDNDVPIATQIVTFEKQKDI